MTDARPIARLKRGPATDVIEFPTYELLQLLRANSAMAETPVADQCSMAALLDCKAVLTAIFNDNVAYLDREPAASLECHERVKQQAPLNASISILDKIINAKRIDTR